jgi:hypothetical protein
MTGGEAGKLLNRFFSKSILITKVTQKVIKRAVTLSLSSTSLCREGFIFLPCNN